jgi:hypothetical protein
MTLMAQRSMRSAIGSSTVSNGFGVGGDRLLDVLLGHDRERRLDGLRDVLALHLGDAGLDPEGAHGVRVLRDRGGHPAALDGLQRLLGAVDADDRHLVLLAGVLHGLLDPEGHRVVRGEEARHVRPRAEDVTGQRQRLVAIPVGVTGLGDLHAAPLRGVLEALRAGVRRGVAGDPPTRTISAPCALSPRPRHVLGAQDAGLPVVGGDERAGSDARLLGLLGADGRVEVHDRPFSCAIGTSGCSRFGRRDRRHRVAVVVGAGHRLELADLLVRCPTRWPRRRP